MDRADGGANALFKRAAADEVAALEGEPLGPAASAADRVLASTVVVAHLAFQRAALFALLAHLAVFGGYVGLAQLFGGFSHAVCQWDCNWYGSIIERGYGINRSFYRRIMGMQVFQFRIGKEIGWIFAPFAPLTIDITR